MASPVRPGRIRPLPATSVKGHSFGYFGTPEPCLENPRGGAAGLAIRYGYLRKSAMNRKNFFGIPRGSVQECVALLEPPIKYFPYFIKDSRDFEILFRPRIRVLRVTLQKF